MGYFDDIEIYSVSTVTTSFNRPPVFHSMQSIGIMEMDPVYLISEKLKIRLETPFLYWGRGGGTATWYSPPGSVRKNTWLLGRGPRLERMVEALYKLSGGKSNLSLKNPGPVVEVFERMLREFKRDSLHSRLFLPLLAEELMAVIEQSIAGKDVSQWLAREVQKTADEIHRDPGGSYDFKQIARDLSISELYFRRCFTKYTGMAPHAYLCQERYLLAIQLLRESNLQMKEIAEQCGFPAPRVFSMFFKQRAGMSPREFRNISY